MLFSRIKRNFLCKIGIHNWFPVDIDFKDQVIHTEECTRCKIHRRIYVKDEYQYLHRKDLDNESNYSGES